MVDQVAEESILGIGCDVGDSVGGKANHVGEYHSSYLEEGSSVDTSISGPVKLDYRDNVPMKNLAPRDGKLHPLLLFDILIRSFPE